MRNPVVIIISIVAVIAFAGGWFYSTPWFAMSGLRDAARDGDKAELSQRIDFPALRESLKVQLTKQIEDEAARSASPLEVSAAGSGLAKTFVEGMVDSVITPDSMASLLVSGSLVPKLDGQSQKDIEWRVKRDGFSTFRAWPEDQTEAEPNAATPALVFKRSGLSWRLSAIEIPERAPAAQ